MASTLGSATQQPNEVLDYDVDYGDWMPQGDSIDTVEASARLLSGTGAPALTAGRVQNTRTVSKVWLSGGSDGSRWRVQTRAFTAQGRVKEAEFDISIREV
jgi:hypothetical protein